MISVENDGLWATINGAVRRPCRHCQAEEAVYGRPIFLSPYWSAVQCAAVDNDDVQH